MKNFVRILMLAAGCLMWLDSVNAQGKSSVSQTVTFSVQRSMQVSVAQRTAATIGNEDVKSVNTVSFVVHDNNATPKKMTMAFNSSLPTSVPLEVHLNSSSSVSSKYLLTSSAREVPTDRQVDNRYQASSNSFFAGRAEQILVFTVTD